MQPTLSTHFSPSWQLRCVRCHYSYHGFDLAYRCRQCGDTLDVIHDFNQHPSHISLQTFDQRLASKDPLNRSGVWRFRELILPIESQAVVTIPEGNTNLYASAKVASFVGLDHCHLKHEGENPTGSFKDRGMTVGITMARALGMNRVACASTGNTSASMASYAAHAGMQALVFIPEGKITYGKLSQTLAYGAKTIQVAGNFDKAMALVEQICNTHNIYLVNSINPFRIEGQKAIAFELLQDLNWQVPDWLIVPGGNLGNNAAIYKGFDELRSLGMIRKLPRIAVIQAQGANPLYQAFMHKTDVKPLEDVHTLATAIRIGNPISWRKSLRGIQATGGLVEQVSDQEIMDAKAHVDSAGIGAEPASCATVAGARKLVAKGIIRSDENVCGILTGHLLKDPDSVIAYHRNELPQINANFPNTPLRAEATLESIMRTLEQAI